jgi:hypothetical protein
MFPLADTLLAFVLVVLAVEFLAVVEFWALTPKTAILIATRNLKGVNITRGGKY